MSKKKLATEKEFWNVKKAGDKLLWRLSPDKNGEYKHFKPNANDFNALKSVLGMINRIEKNNVSNNKLFAKLFINFLTQEIRFHGSTIFDSNILLNVSNKLSYPLDAYYTAFVKDLQENQWNKLLKDKTKEEQLETVKLYNEFKETYSFEYVSSQLNKNINEALLIHS